MSSEMAQFRPSAPRYEGDDGDDDMEPGSSRPSRSGHRRTPSNSGRRKSGSSKKKRGGGPSPKNSGRNKAASSAAPSSNPPSRHVHLGEEPSSARKYRADKQHHKASSDDGDRSRHGHVVHKVIPAQIAKSESQYANIHMDLRRLMDEERMLLQTETLTANEKQRFKEGFFFQQMELLMKLPPEEQVQYHPKKRVISRMGTTRHNLYNEDEEEHKPVFCVSMGILNCLAFLLEMREADWHFENLNKNPMIGPDFDTLLNSGAKSTPKIKDDGQWWRLFLPIILHAGIIHLLVDTLVLARLGASIERAFGFYRVGIIYIASGVFGTMLSATFLPDVVTVGASGSLFGLIGALFGDFIQNHKTIIEGKWGYFAQLVVTTVIGLCIGLFPGVDNFTHFGGWIMGLLLANFLLAGVIKDSHGMPVTTWYTTPLALISALLSVALFIVGYSLLYSQDEVNCGWCESINCLDTPYWDC